MPDRPRVAVIGAGWAGMAAAVTLVDCGVPVVVFEASRSLGGRARRVGLDGADVDNGQHILIGAYLECLRLIGRVGVSVEQSLARLPFELRVLPGFRVRAAQLPAPLHLLAGLLTARGISLSERFAAARFAAALRARGYRVDSKETVNALLARHRQSGRLQALLWGPLCVSALNTPPERASAQVFANVLRDTVGAERAASDLLLPRVHLGALFPEPAAEHVRARGGEVHLGRPVRRIDVAGDGLCLDGDDATFQRVVLATAPHHALALAVPHATLAPIARQLADFAYEPIYTCYLQYPRGVRLPFPMLGLEGRLAHWVFDRGALGGPDGLLAAVVSASGPHEELSLDDFAATVHHDLAESLRGLAPPQWTRVIAERRATFSCRPGLSRPSVDTPLRGLFLAGDYTESDYPGTLEAAVRSGIEAATRAMQAR